MDKIGEQREKRQGKLRSSHPKPTGSTRMNRWNVLMRGAFIPSTPGNVYPVLMGHRDGKAIAALYADAVAQLPDLDFEAVDLVNAKASSGVVLELQRKLGRVEIVVRDTRGKEVERGSRRLTPGIHLFSVPPSGLVTIRRKN